MFRIRVSVLLAVCVCVCVWWCWFVLAFWQHRNTQAGKITPNIKWFCLTYFVIKCGNVHISLHGKFPFCSFFFDGCFPAFSHPHLAISLQDSPLRLLFVPAVNFRLPSFRTRQPDLAYFTWTLCSVNFLNYWPRLYINCRPGAANAHKVQFRQPAMRFSQRAGELCFTNFLT